jgi:SulP family sulfate permease
VFGGVVLSVIVFFISAANEVHLVQFVLNPDGSIAEKPAPKELPSRAVTILQIYGSLFFAGATQLQSELPSAQNSERPIVIMRMRPYTEISSTFINVIEDYASRIQARGGKLMLTGVSTGVQAQLERTEIIEELLGVENVYLATENVGFSTRSAAAAAERWLGTQPSDASPDAA